MTHTLDPSIPVITVRQPWADLIARGFKDVENRTWSTTYRGPLYIHAAAGMTTREYEDCSWFTRISRTTSVPPARYLDFAAVIARVTLVDCVRAHPSVWFTGPVGWILADAAEIDPVPCRGRPGLWHIRPKDLIP